MSELSLTAHQEEALAWITSRLEAGERLLALRGLAGTGKSTLIPVLRSRLAAQGIVTQVGAPTHRAAMVLKRKGIRDANTLHAHALAPYFLPEYAAAMRYLGEDVRTREPLEDSGGYVDALGRPLLLVQQLRDDADAWQALKHTTRRHNARKALASVGLQGKQYFDGFGPKLGEGCLVIDEASMVGREQLDLCLQAFVQVVLVGDPGQLPPVQDFSVLADIEGFDLTEIHRQAAGSPILQLAYAARRGEPFWRERSCGGAIEDTGWLDPHALLTSPLLVWRNVTRLQCTAAIRAALGYGTTTLQAGEPLVCRATSAADREEGFYNNAQFRVVEVSTTDPRHVTVQAEGADEVQDVYVHLEEWHGERIDPQAVPFRLGYCLTAHTAQGGEWPQVAISKPDLLAYIGRCQRYQQMDEVAQWAYTVITRAKASVQFLQRHCFEAPAQASGPQGEWMMASRLTPLDVPTAPPTPTFVTDPAPDPEPEPAPLTDDIPDTPVSGPVMAAMQRVPPGPYLPPLPPDALLNQFCATLEAKMTAWVAEQSVSTMKALDAVLAKMVECLDKVAVANDHAQYQLSHTLEALMQQGVQVRGAPYTVELQAQTPQGFAVAFRLTKASAQALAEATEALVAWLQSAGYGGVSGVSRPAPRVQSVPLGEDEDIPF